MKEKITKQSIKLFQEKGFSETSIQDIVDALGVTKGTFYYYFTSKEILLMEIHLRYIDDLLTRQKVIIESTKNCREKIIGIVSLVILDIKSQRANGRVYFREMRNLTPENAKKVKKKREEFRLNIEAVLSEGIKSGEFRESIDPKMISLAILGVTNWSYNWFNPEGEVSVEELAEKYVDFVLYGISLQK